MPNSLHTNGQPEVVTRPEACNGAVPKSLLQKQLEDSLVAAGLCACDPLADKYSSHRDADGWLRCARCSGRIGAESLASQQARMGSSPVRQAIAEIVSDPRGHESAAAVDATVGKLLERADTVKDVVELGDDAKLRERLTAISPKWTLRTTDEWLVGGGRKVGMHLHLHIGDESLSADGRSLAELVALAEAWSMQFKPGARP